METSVKTTLLIGGLLLVGLIWLNRDEYAIPKMAEYAGPIDMSQYEPVLTVEEWERACNPEYKGKKADSHCTIQVQVDCPPDCGVYKMLREDKLLRRVW